MSASIWAHILVTFGSKPKTCCALVHQQCLIRLRGTGSQRVYGSRHRPRAGQPVLERKLRGLQGVALRGSPCQLCPQRLEAKGPSDSCGKATRLLRGGACKSAGLHEVCMKDLLECMQKEYLTSSGLCDCSKGHCDCTNRLCSYMKHGICMKDLFECMQKEHLTSLNFSRA